MIGWRHSQPPARSHLLQRQLEDETEGNQMKKWLEWGLVRVLQAAFMEVNKSTSLNPRDKVFCTNTHRFLQLSLLGHSIDFFFLCMYPNQFLPNPKLNLTLILDSKTNQDGRKKVLLYQDRSLVPIRLLVLTRSPQCHKNMQTYDHISF